MVDWLFLIISGAVIGVIVAAPIGPVNLICIRRTLAYGPLNGFLSGVGAAIGDGVFAATTAFGLTAISRLIEGYTSGLQFAGGVILLAFGLHTFFAEPHDLEPGEAAAVRGSGLVTAVLSTFALTITNPATLVGFAALFTGLGSVVNVQTEVRYVEAGILVAAVFAGSALWWFALTAFTGIFHGRFTPSVMKRINQGTGVFVGLFGVVVLGHLALERLPGVLREFGLV